MTPEQWATIRHFAPTECTQPEAADYEFMVFLDDVRDVYGESLIITGDGRTVAQEAAQPSHAIPPESGLHVFDLARGLFWRAVDLRWIEDPAKRDRLQAAMYRVRVNRPTELEWVPFGSNKHIHLGLFRQSTHPSRVEFSPA